MVDMNRATVALPTEFATQIFANVQEASAVAALATHLALPGAGVSVPVMTADPEAQWVDETEEKTVDTPTVSNKVIKGYTLAVIVPFSNQFKRDAQALYDGCVSRLPGALAKKIDATVFGSTAPGTGFDVLGGAQSQGIAGNTYAGLVAADAAVSAAGGIVDGYVLSPQARSTLLGAVDGAQRPLFINSAAEGAVPVILGARAVTSQGAYAAGGTARLGYAGQFADNLYFGTVEGVNISVSDQASITSNGQVLNLWQRNMFAVRAEIEVGVAVRDLNKIVKLTNAEVPDATV